MRTSLHIGDSLPAAWDSVLLPWFKAVGQTTLTSSDRVAVITPFPTQATWLRTKLLECGFSLIGVQFLTPAILREFLFQRLNLRIPMHEHLRFLLAIVAEEFLETASENELRHKDPDYLAAKSVARAPDYFLRAIDQFSAGGWDFAEEGTRDLRPLFNKFREQSRACGFDLIYDADRAVRKKLATQAPLFSDLLIAGFDGAHWPLWPLLNAAINSSNRSTVVLGHPPEQSRTTDEAWIGTWEQSFGAAIPIPHANLSDLNETIVRPSSTVSPTFLIGLNSTEQAEAIVAIASQFLSEQSDARVGIVFPRGGPLSRLVASQLSKIGILHNDVIAHSAGPEPRTVQLNAWMDLQRNPQLTPLLQFLNALTGNKGDFFEQLVFENVRRILQRACRKVLIDDVGVLREYCARQTGYADSVAVTKILGRINFLPNRATFSNFLAETKRCFAGLGWDAEWNEIEPLARDWMDAVGNEIVRPVFLRWLNEIIRSSQKLRDPAGDHPYSRVHLLTYDQAEGQDWSHLILTGLNQGEWPPSENESRWLDDSKTAELNKRALQQGKQGEGHTTLREGKTFLLGAQERRQIASRRFAAACESASHGLALTASFLNESAPERIWNPSELFTQKYFATCGKALTQSAMSDLRQQTRDWLDKQPLFKSNQNSESGAVSQTRVAYDARRSPNQFGEYEFALLEPTSRQVTLRATEWDKVVKTPALIWLKVYLGVESNERSLNEWVAATGEWIHDWLKRISNATSFVDFPSPEEIRKRVRNAAIEFRNQIEDLCSSGKRKLPDWWVSGWSTAVTLAHCLADNLEGLTDWPYLAAEWILDSPQLVTLAPNEQLRFRGRIDLILKRGRTNENDFASSDLWIVDYKTGSAKPLRAPTSKTSDGQKTALRKKLIRGEAVQLGLYALAARELGAREIALSLLSPRADLETPQLRIADILVHSDFWKALYRMQETGVFGLLGPMRSEFSFAANLPLATLPIDDEFLREKWATTHPDLVDDEER